MSEAIFDEPLREVAAALASKRISAVELLNESHSRICKFDTGEARLGATLQLDERAFDYARKCDSERQAGRSFGPLHGVPVIVKDNINVAGLPTTSGNRSMAGAMPHADCSQVHRLRGAGAIVIGKANLSEFSFEVRSRSSLGGDVLNPFRRTVTSGGSSGGTAVAVSVGFAVAGLGTDTGGSIRVPAAYTGLVGLRPTYGRLAMTGIAPLAPSTDTVGPIARTVDDAALIFALMAGRNRPNAARPIRGRRVGVVEQAFGTDPEVLTATDDALKALTYHGVEVLSVPALPDHLLPEDRPHIVDEEFVDAFDRYLSTNFVAGTAPASVAAIVESGASLPDYADVLRMRLAHSGGAQRAAVLAYHAELRAALAKMMRALKLDALAFPVSVTVPQSLDNPKGGWAPELAACSGWPALSVPMGRAVSGIPIGLELLAQADQEDILFDLARHIEQAVGPRAIPPLI